MVSYKNFVLYLLLAIIPAIFLNEFLLNKIQPKKSAKRLILYIAALLAVTFGYTVLTGWILLRFVWPLKQ
jgi:hypothetical protein